MVTKVDVAIIGGGSAGISALRQIKKYTDNFLLVDHAPLGTKCARVGCMPSKALISVAKDFHRRRVFQQEGILGEDNLNIDIPSVLAHVRKLRDQFTNGMVKTTKELAGDKLILGKAEIKGPNQINVEGIDIHAEKIIIAAGSRARIPDEWKTLGSRLLTSDNIFEQKDLPKKIAVVGLGPIGLELGQALSRLGIDIVGFTHNPVIAKTADPKVSEETLKIFREEFPIYVDTEVSLIKDNGKILVRNADAEFTVDAVLASTGVEPDIEGLGLENLGVELNERGLPSFDKQTSQIQDLPVYIAGDVNGWRPILHEALDEGFIAGRNSVSKEINSYCRRIPLYLVFTDPQIAFVGQNYKELMNNKTSFVIGEADFSEQARAMLELHNKGLVHIYVDKDSARLLGAELICPYAEHLGHLLAIGIQHNATIFDMLQMPFYHPTVEEGLRTALRDAAGKVSPSIEPQGLTLCDSCPEASLF